MSSIPLVAFQSLNLPNYKTPVASGEGLVALELSPRMVVLAHDFRVKVYGEVFVKSGHCFGKFAELEDLLDSLGVGIQGHASSGGLGTDPQGFFAGL